MTDLQVGDVVHMKLVPPGVADVTVIEIGTCTEDLGPDPQGNPIECGMPTVVFNDPESGELDEVHAAEFQKV